MPVYVSIIEGDTVNQPDAIVPASRSSGQGLRVLAIQSWSSKCWKSDCHQRVVAIQSQIVTCWKSDCQWICQDSFSHGKFWQFKVEVLNAGKLSIWQVPVLTWSWQVLAIQSRSFKCRKTQEVNAQLTVCLLTDNLWHKQCSCLNSEFCNWRGRIRKFNCTFWLWCGWIRNHNHKFTPTTWQNQKLQYYNVAESEVAILQCGRIRRFCALSQSFYFCTQRKLEQPDAWFERYGGCLSLVSGEGGGWRLLLDAKTTKQVQTNNAGRSLKSVSNSETDVTVNVTGFAKVLVRQMTQKSQQIQVDGPQQRLGTEQRLTRGWKARKQWENG